jgi:hypothetical protein
MMGTQYLGVEELEGDGDVRLVEVPPSRGRHPVASGMPSKPARNGKIPPMFTVEEREDAVREVMQKMAEGHTMTAAARALGLPESTVRLWIANNPAWLAEYRRTKVVLGWALADKALEVAQEAKQATFQADRLHVDTLRWLASKVNPDEFGDRTVTEQTGEVTLRIVVEEETIAPQGKAAETMRISARTVVEEATVTDALIEPIPPQIAGGAPTGATPPKAKRKKPAPRSGS